MRVGLNCLAKQRSVFRQGGGNSSSGSSMATDDLIVDYFGLG
jgi:hypothetical protein